jgi:hypothetical protein
LGTGFLTGKIYKSVKGRPQTPIAVQTDDQAAEQLTPVPVPPVASVPETSPPTQKAPERPDQSLVPTDSVRATAAAILPGFEELKTKYEEAALSGNPRKMADFIRTYLADRIIDESGLSGFVPHWTVYVKDVFDLELGEGLHRGNSPRPFQALLDELPHKEREEHWLVDRRMKFKPGETIVRVVRDGAARIADQYAVAGVGVHGPTGAPRDHVAIDSGGRIVEAADYGAPSKDGVYLPGMLRILLPNQLTSGITTSPKESLRRMLADLKSLREFQERGEGTEVYGGLFSWNTYLPNGTRRITEYAGRLMVPTLDNSQTTFGGLAALAGALWDAKPGTLEREVRDLALEIIDHQDYRKFIDNRGNLIEEYVFGKGPSYKSGHHLLSTEWAIGDLYAYLTKIMSQQAWENLNHESFVWESPDGPLDMLQFYIWSAHEAWILQYFAPQIAKSELYPLYLNFAYLHARHASDNGMPGFAATEYIQPGVYVPAGPNPKGLIVLDHPANLRVTLATSYGTSLVSLIHPPLLEWLEYLYKQPGVMTRMGPVTGFDRATGGSRVFTADSSFSTLNSMGSLGAFLDGQPDIVNRGILRFLKEKYGLSEADVIEAFNLHARLILADISRNPTRLAIFKKYDLGPNSRRFLTIRPSQIPSPPVRGDYSVEKAKAKQLPGDNVNLMTFFPRTGWFVGRANEPQLRGDEFKAAYFIRPNDDQYAFVGAALDQPFPISVAGAKNGKPQGFRSVSLWVPVDLKAYWEIEIKNGGQEIAQRVRVDTRDQGQLSADGKWKRLVYPFHPNVSEGAEPQDFNTIAFSVPDPKYNPNPAQGVIHFRSLQFHTGDSREIEKANSPGPAEASSSAVPLQRAILPTPPKSVTSQEPRRQTPGRVSSTPSPTTPKPVAGGQSASYESLKKQYEQAALSGDPKQLMAFVRTIADISFEPAGFASSFTVNPKSGAVKKPRPFKELLQALEKARWATLKDTVPRSELRATEMTDNTGPLMQIAEHYTGFLVLERVRRESPAMFEQIVRALAASRHWIPDEQSASALELPLRVQEFLASPAGQAIQAIFTEDHSGDAPELLIRTDEIRDVSTLGTNLLYAMTHPNSRYVVLTRNQEEAGRILRAVNAYTHETLGMEMTGNFEVLVIKGSAAKTVRELISTTQVKVSRESNTELRVAVVGGEDSEPLLQAVGIMKNTLRLLSGKEIIPDETMLLAPVLLNELTYQMTLQPQNIDAYASGRLSVLVQQMKAFAAILHAA